MKLNVIVVRLVYVSVRLYEKEFPKKKKKKYHIQSIQNQIQTNEMMLVFTVICTLLKMKEQNNDYLDYFSDNEMIEVSMKIFNANCVDYGT